MMQGGRWAGGDLDDKAKEAIESPEIGLEAEAKGIEEEKIYEPGEIIGGKEKGKSDNPAMGVEVGEKDAEPKGELGEKAKDMIDTPKEDEIDKDGESAEEHDRKEAMRGFEKGELDVMLGYAKLGTQSDKEEEKSKPIPTH